MNQMKGEMADMEIRYDKVAVKFLQGLPQKLRDSIREAIKGADTEAAQRRYKAAGTCMGPGFYKADAGRAETAGSGRRKDRQRGICER